MRAIVLHRTFAIDITIAFLAAQISQGQQVQKVVVVALLLLLRLFLRTVVMVVAVTQLDTRHWLSSEFRHL